jgi:hypothetical protein
MHPKIKAKQFYIGMLDKTIDSLTVYNRKTIRKFHCFTLCLWSRNSPLKFGTNATLSHSRRKLHVVKRSIIWITASVLSPFGLHVYRN